MDSNGSMTWYTSLYITYQAINPFVPIAIDASFISERYFAARSSRFRWAQAFVVGGLCRLVGRTRTATLALDCVALRHCHPHQWGLDAVAVVLVLVSRFELACRRAYRCESTIMYVARCDCNCHCCSCNHIYQTHARRWVRIDMRIPWPRGVG